MAVTVDANLRSPPAPQRTIVLGGRAVPVVGPKIRDPRVHLALTTVTILTIGMTWLDFRLSIPQVGAALIACGALDIVRTYRADGMLVWPASALQTATSTALILRVTGFEAHQWWSFEGWYYFAGVATVGVLTKYHIRRHGRHVFNPSNVALVAAFVVLGSDRIEPLDFWWVPFGWAMLAVYAVIVLGGITLCRRLRLLEMATAFYVTFGVGVGVLALLGQSITTQWSLAPVSGLHFWWVLVTSPETLIFLFFMITDPRTTPAGRPGRIVFGCAVGVASTVLLAPWQTEFGAKVGLLSGLLVVTAVRPFVGRWSSERASLRFSLGTASLAAATFVAAVAVAGAPNRSAASPEPPPPSVTFDVEPDSLPPVSIDDDVAALSAELATPAGAQELAAALAFNLRVEAEALRSRDVSLLPAVAHGERLDDVRATIEQAAGDDIVVPAYRFDTLHLSIVYPGGAQRGANAGLTATGTVTRVTYSPTGARVGATEQAIEVMFALRETTSGRWLTTDTPPLTAGS